MELSVSVERPAADRIVLVVQGSVDLASRDRLRAAAEREFGPDARVREVDLGGVTFMDSTGLGTLVEIAGDAEDVDAEFRVVNPSRQVLRLLEITGLSERLVG